MNNMFNHKTKDMDIKELERYRNIMKALQKLNHMFKIGEVPSDLLKLIGYHKFHNNGGEVSILNYNGILEFKFEMYVPFDASDVAYVDVDEILKLIQKEI